MRGPNWKRLANTIHAKDATGMVGVRGNTRTISTCGSFRRKSRCMIVWSARSLMFAPNIDVPRLEVQVRKFLVKHGTDRLWTNQIPQFLQLPILCVDWGHEKRYTRGNSYQHHLKTPRTHSLQLLGLQIHNPTYLSNLTSRATQAKQWLYHQLLTTILTVTRVIAKHQLQCNHNLAYCTWLPQSIVFVGGCRYLRRYHSLRQPLSRRIRVGSWTFRSV